MRWQLLHSIDQIHPGQSIRGSAVTGFPPELYADHFPSFPVTPGVLLVEIGAQLGGLLVQATVYQEKGHWVFPVLTMIQETKLRTFVPPDRHLQVSARLLSLRPEAALVATRLTLETRRCASSKLMLAFDPEGGVAGGEPETLARFTRDQFRRLGSPWQPSTAAETTGTSPS